MIEGTGADVEATEMGFQVNGREVGGGTEPAQPLVWLFAPIPDASRGGCRVLLPELPRIIRPCRLKFTGR